MSNFTLPDLARIIDERAHADDPSSYTRKLMGKGVPKIAQKVGEEAVELAIAAVQNDPKEVKAETADLFYHILVLLQAMDVPLEEVMRELAQRTNQTGLEEKASRPKD